MRRNTLVVAPEVLGEDLASSYFIELLPQAPAAWETGVRKAVKATLAAAEPSCSQVLTRWPTPRTRTRGPPATARPVLEVAA